MELLGDLERAVATLIYPNRVAFAIVTVLVVALLAVAAWRRRWDRPIRRHPRATAIVALTAVALGGPVAWYLGSPLVISTTIDEPPPVVAAATPSPRSAPPAAAEPTRPASSDTQGLLERAGTFAGADEFHFGRGTARLVETAPGSYVVRLEDFEVRNGPDLFVYLSPSPDGYADGAVELGRLKADRGNQNYEVPPGTDVGAARSVVIWCRQFAVLFATAPLD